MRPTTTDTVSSTELRSFQPRVGRTPQARLQWALEFCRRELTALTAGDWFNLQREFLAFAAVTITPDALGVPWIRQLIAGEPWGAAWATAAPPRGARGRARGAREGARLSASAQIQDWDLPSRDALHDVQREWRAIVLPLLRPEGFARGGPFKMEVYVERVDKEGRARIDFVPEEPDPAARLPLLGLLGAFAHRLRECPEPSCQRWFVATRTGQTFCGRTCQNRASIRAFRGRKARPNRSSGGGGVQRPKASKRTARMKSK